MEAFAADALDIIQSCHAGLRKVVQEADPEALHWQPGPEMNAISTLVIHVLGSEKFWLARVTGEEIARDRDAEFRSLSNDRDMLLRRLDEADADVKTYLGRYKASDGERQFPYQERSASGVWGVMLVIEHLREHMAHSELTLQFWKLRAAAG